MIGEQILNYKITALLGEGGMGNVYLGEHITIQRKVAIKVLKPDLAKNDQVRNRFKNEASLLAQLYHPNIVGLIDYQENENGLYLIMEYVDGIGLDDFIRNQQSPVAIERARSIFQQILQAFQYAHQNGIVHRDVKPSNILITAGDQIKVLDFGIAKLIGENNHSLTKTGTQLGTVYYMSPEQVRGQKIDHRSDIYSLGVTFYELLTGVCPYKSMTTEYEIYESIVKTPLLPLTNTMGETYSHVWEIIEKATQKDAVDRFQDCSSMLDGLTDKNPKRPVIEKPVSTGSSTHTPPPVTPKPQPAAKKNSTPILLISILGFLVICGIGLYFMNAGDTEETTTESELTISKAHVLIDFLNLRDASSTNANSITKIPFGSEFELIGEPTEPMPDDKFLIRWQKAQWNGQEGWVGVEIDQEQTIGNQQDVQEIRKILNGGYEETAEYQKMRLWAHHLVRKFIKSKNQLGNYTLKALSRNKQSMGYRSIIRYHFNPYADSESPYDFLIFLDAKNGNKIALFCRANEDGIGGKVDGWCYLPSDAAYFSYTKEENGVNGDFSVGEISVHNAYGDVICYLDDESHTTYYSSVYESYGC